MPKLTGPQVEKFTLPPGKSQAFLWDSLSPGLAVRATRGAKSFIFQTRFDGRSLRVTIGDARVWALEEAIGKDGTVIRPGARQEARRLQAFVDQGRDPRQVRRETVAADAAKNAADARKAVTVATAWDAYLRERRPHWSKLHYQDHVKGAQLGGEKRKRGKGLTVAGPLAELMPIRLPEVTPAVILAWAKREIAKRPTRARLALRLFAAFLRWAAEEDAYRGAVSLEAVDQKKLRDVIGGSRARSDCLQREQLKSWFAEVRKLENPVQSAFLQAALLTGARRGELATLRWDDVDLRWGSVRLHDKVEFDRVVPLTPYFRDLLLDLRKSGPVVVPVRGAKNVKASGWVFPAASASGHIAEPRAAHQRALKAAGLPSVSIHGLRRSFGTLSEWCEVPTGVVAQIQGHRPSATAEKHYRVRPLDLLRLWHSKIEAWILAQAGVEQPKETPLGAVKAA